MTTKNSPSLVHPQAIVESKAIGQGTRVWEFAHVMKGAVIGARCNIGAGCFIEDGAVIGDDVVIKNGVCVWRGVTIEDGAFVGPGVILTNEREPRSGFPKALAETRIARGASLAAGCIIVAPVTVGEYATVGPGAVVIRDVGPHELVLGHPAALKGYMCVCGRKLFSVKEPRAKGSCECGRTFTFAGGRLTVSKS